MTVPALVLLAACTGDEVATAGLDGAAGDQTLPSVTAAPADPEADDAADDAAGEATDTTEAAGGDAAGPDDEPEPTTTTEPLDPLLGLEAELVAEGFDQPILVTGAPGTSSLYVVEREGMVWVVDDGEVAPTPFLDLRSELLSSSIEQGLLGLAFHPSFASTGRFYAYWTDPEGNSVLAQLVATEPAVADPDSIEVVLTVDQPAERHNAGMIQFGPDGLLYLSLGDGGSGGEPAQDTSNLLGTIVRIDVDPEPGEAADGQAYAIPDGNPFGTELWVYGLRNPWRFSIDPETSMVYIGDVGQEALEEINVVGLDGAGANFGWREMEGDECFRSGCDPEGLTLPVLQYDHLEGCSVTGGWVYRGAAIPELVGHYFFADWCKGFVRSFRLDDGRVTDQLDWSTDLAAVGQVTSFGLDDQRELYTVNWDGQLHRIVARR